MRSLTWFVPILALACGEAVEVDSLDAADAGLTTPNGNVRYVGYYASTFREDNYIAEIAHYTNVIDLNVVDPYIVARAEEAHQRGSKVTIYVGGCFFWPNDTLREDWEYAWNQLCRPAIDQVLATGVEVLAIDIMDEPTGNGLENWEIETGSCSVKSAYPTIKTLINESDLAPTPAACVDVRSRTCYEPLPVCQDSYEQLKAWHPGPISVVAQAFDYSPTDPITAEETVQFWDWARSDPRFIGYKWFLYPSLVGTGTRDLPWLKALHERLALNDILCNNSWENKPVCGADRITYPNPDQAKCAQVAIAYYGDCETIGIAR